jgi:hypothetical protein
MSWENEIDNEEMINIVCRLQGLPEYRRKEIAILLMHSTLNGYASEQLAGFAAGLAEIKQAEQAEQAKVN